MSKRKKDKLCSECIYLQKDGDDWICGCGRGFVEPIAQQATVIARVFDGTRPDIVYLTTDYKKGGQDD